MIRLSFFSVLLSLALGACTKGTELEKRVELYPNNRMKREWYQIKISDHRAVLHGAYREYYESGANEETSTWKEGTVDGFVTAWYESGTTKWEKRFREGKRTGMWRLTYGNGDPAMALQFVDGRPEGEVMFWPRPDTADGIMAVFRNGACDWGDCAFLQDLLAGNVALLDSVGRKGDAELMRGFLHELPAEEEARHAQAEPWRR